MFRLVRHVLPIAVVISIILATATTALAQSTDTQPTPQGYSYLWLPTIKNGGQVNEAPVKPIPFMGATEYGPVAKDGRGPWRNAASWSIGASSVDARPTMQMVPNTEFLTVHPLPEMKSVYSSYLFTTTGRVQATEVIPLASIDDYAYQANIIDPLPPGSPDLSDLLAKGRSAASRNLEIWLPTWFPLYDVRGIDPVPQPIWTRGFPDVKPSPGITYFIRFNVVGVALVNKGDGTLLPGLMLMAASQRNENVIPGEDGATTISGVDAALGYYRVMSFSHLYTSALNPRMENYWARQITTELEAEDVSGFAFPRIDIPAPGWVFVEKIGALGAVIGAGFYLVSNTAGEMFGFAVLPKNCPAQDPSWSCLMWFDDPMYTGPNLTH